MQICLGAQDCGFNQSVIGQPPDETGINAKENRLKLKIFPNDINVNNRN